MTERATTPESGLTGFQTFVLLLIPFVWTFEASSVGPDLGRIAEAFRTASELQVKLVMTVPLLTAVLFSVISGKLTNYIDRKIVLIVGLLIYGITGVLPVVSTTINQLLVLRLITGVGVGLVTPIPNAIITERFAGDRQHRLLGMTSSIAMVANVIASLVSGALLTYGWQYPFYTYSILFVIALFSLAGIPSNKPLRNAASAPAESLRALPLSVYGLFAFMTVNFAIQGIITTSLALFMTSASIGQPWAIGVVLCFPAVACIFLSPLYPEIARALRSALIPLSFAAYALGYWVSANSHSVLSISVGALLVGFGNSMLTPHILTLTAARIRPAQRNVAYGVVTAGIAAGLILSPFVQALMVTVGSNSSPRFVFLSAAAVSVAIALISILLSRAIGVTTPQAL